MASQEELNRLATTLTFNGTSTRVEIPDSSGFSVPTTGAITISAWIRPDVLNFPTTIDGGADGGYIDWLGKGDYLAPTQFEWNFRMYNNSSPTRPNRISFYVFNIGGGTGVGSYVQETVVAGQWIHIVGKIDSSKTYIYKNGVLKDSDVYTASITPADGTAPLYIGTTSLGDPSFFKGAIKDVIIFNRALGDAEVTALYNGTVPSGVVSRWYLNDRSNTITDSVGSNHGTLTSGIWSAPMSRQDCLNELIHNADHNIDSRTAANTWAGTTNNTIQDALNTKAGTSNRTRQDALKNITSL